MVEVVAAHRVDVVCLVEEVALLVAVQVAEEADQVAVHGNQTIIPYRMYIN